MIILKVICVSIASLVLMFFLTKIMGNKQMSELTMFDYINGITIGSIAAEMSTSEVDEVIKPITAMIVYALAATAISFAVNKSIRARRFLSGKSVIVYNNGKINKKNLTKVKLDLNEFLSQCRINGYFNLSDIQTAVFEPNGRLSILPKSNSKPLTADDMGIKVTEASVLTTVILDGNLMQANLKHTGNDETWLVKELEKQGYSSVKKVFLGLVDSNNTLYIYDADNKSSDNDIFQ